MQQSQAPGQGTKRSFNIELTARRVKGEELMHLSRQLSAFIQAGLPVLAAVHTIAADTNNTTVRAVMLDIEDGLRRGERFSDCLEEHPRVFPDFYRGIVRSAELTGDLGAVLSELARYLDRDLEARRKIKSAMVYPAAVAALSSVTVAVLAVWVLPKFTVFFHSLGAKLPLSTRILLALTNFIGDWWWALIFVAVVTGLVVSIAVQTPRGRYLRDLVVLRVPVLGAAIEVALVERFCRILASMISAGVSLPESLRVSTRSLHNLVFEQRLATVGEAMLEGEGLAGPLLDSNVFPTTAAQMISVGEDTGTLDTQLEVTARFYEGELDYRVKRLTSLFEPLVIIVMGVIVGFVAIALVSAMYGIYGQVKIQ